MHLKVYHTKKTGTIFFHKGFLSIATILLMITSLGLVVTMLYRSTQGSIIAGTLKHSNQAYQYGDSLAEKVLQDFRSFDNGQFTASIDSTKKIPENVSALDFCVPPIVCYDSTGARITDPNVKLNEIVQVSASNTTSSVTRAIQASVPQRISTPQPNIDASVLVTGVHISWNSIIDTDAELIEIRRARLYTSAQQDESAGQLLTDTSLDWTVVDTVPLTDTSIDDTDVVVNYTYAYTLKITNNSPLMLDSLYATPKKVTVVPLLPTGQSVTSLTLVNADTDTDIQTITNGAIINTSTLPTNNLNVRANTNPATVGSVKFVLDGNASSVIENTAPYALFGDLVGNYNAGSFALGSHTITATTYTGSNATGTAGTPFSVSFTKI